MSQIITVDDLISQVRSLLDEDNRESVDDTIDIISALNRAQNYAANILSRHYESPLLTKQDVTTVSGQMEYDIPEDAFEQRIEKLEARINNTFYPLQRIDYRDISRYENKSSTSVPYYYVIVGTRYRIIPASNSAYPLRMWYLQDPMPLLKSQGRINTVNEAGNYVIVDDVGDDITTETDQLNSYVNIIDAQTGKRKATFQVKNVSGNRITFKSSPSRSTVLNISIDTDLTDLYINDNSTEPRRNEGPTVSVEPDDYICIIKGSCVPFFKKPFSNFLVQYAVAEIRRKLGGPAELEQRILKELEEQVERSWVGRETTLRVKKTNGKWDLPVRRFYGTTDTN
jgi:hypothetical protein